MGTSFPDLFAALIRPFDKDQVKTRTAPGGRTLSYITARTAANRLDEVLGPENWSDRLVMLSENSFLCELTIVLPDGRTVTRCDVGGMAGMQDAGDDDKSGASDSFKRACAKLGVARYLYRDGVPRYDGEAPAPAAPSANGHREHAAESRSHVAHPSRPPENDEPSRRQDAPRSGSALFAWCKQQEEQHDVALVKYLQGWGKVQDFPPRMVDWDASQIAAGHSEAVRKLKETGHGSGGDEEEQPPPANPDALRKQLVNAVWRIAKADTGKDRPSDGDYFAALADLDNAVAGSGGRVIPEITDCRDPSLLSAYLRAARDRLDAAGV